MPERTRPVGALGEVVARAADPAYPRWAEQVAHAGFCARPVRLRGGVDVADPATGALRAVYSTDAEPDGTVLKACGQRRETVCPACSAVYRADAWQLIAAGLRGGKGLPESVAGHPRLFLTLTAPSFGAVHSRRETNGRVQTCRPRRGQCEHGTPAGCFCRHRDADRALGSPLCGDCFDYPGAVLWNAHAPALWARTTTYVRRALARTAGVDVAVLARTVRVSYVKVAEFQARGLVHFHLVARLDGVPADRDGPPVPPPEQFTAATLERAIREAIATVAVPYPGPDGTRRLARWGTQVDIREITNTTEADAVGAEMVAAYIAKYATKSAATLGVLDRPLTGEDIDRLRVGEHIRMMVETCWALGVREEYRPLRLRRWAHMLGFGGHWGTKSRAYSTTFRALRDARAAWATQQRDHPAEADTDAEALEHWQTVGIGYRTDGDAWLAETAARDHAESRVLAREDAKTAGGKPDHRPQVSSEPPTISRRVNDKSSPTDNRRDNGKGREKAAGYVDTGEGGK